MKRGAAIALVLLLFVVGVAVGVLGTHLFYAREIARYGGGSGFGVHRFSQRLEHALDLTEEQRLRIDEILEQSRVEGDALQREMLPAVRDHMRQTRERIRDVLTPEQQAKFDELHRRHRGRAERFFLGRGGHRPHGPPRRHEPPPPRPDRPTPAPPEDDPPAR